MKTSNLCLITLINPFFQGFLFCYLQLKHPFPAESVIFLLVTGPVSNASLHEELVALAQLHLLLVLDLGVLDELACVRNKADALEIIGLLLVFDNFLIGRGHNCDQQVEHHDHHDQGCCDEEELHCHGRRIIFPFHVELAQA